VIGAKSLATLVLLAVAVVAAPFLGLLSPERLATRGWGTLFVAGLFALVVGTLIHRFWRLGEPSQHYFRWSSEATPWEQGEGHFLGSETRRITLGENRRGEAFDLQPWQHHAAFVVIALVLALGCLDARALPQLGEFKKGMSAATGSYCPEPGAQPEVADVNAPGCELVRRAYALGYATTLGDCEVKAKAAEKRAVCNRRQRDEPFLHFAWRLLDVFWHDLRSTARRSYFAEVRRDFDEHLGHLGSLRTAQRQVLASAPHAAHHIWTNLPDPGDDAFRAESCADKYRWLPHRPAPAAEGEKRASLVFEHVVAQLLFEGRYEPAAGFCRELHVHWGAPSDACAQLAANPEGFLAAAGALTSVKAVLDRHRVNSELVGLGAPKQTLAPPAFVSFQCYIEAGGEPGQQRRAVTVGGQRFEAEEVRMPPAARALSPLFIDRYDAVARLLVNGFHYGRLLSEAGLETGPAEGLAASFSGRDFLLTRLYGLESVDIYLGPGWIADRPDLLEVYPYQRHLKNYVQTFRRQYRQQRGRL
jgi:hypothetical protein